MQRDRSFSSIPQTGDTKSISIDAKSFRQLNDLPLNRHQIPCLSMLLRLFHLRLLQLNAGLIALVAALGTTSDLAGPTIWPYLATVPITTLALYIFSKWQNDSGPMALEDPEQDTFASKTESRMVTATMLVVLILGLGCAAVIALIPEHTFRIAWVLPCLGANLGSSAEAYERLSRRH